MTDEVKVNWPKSVALVVRQLKSQASNWKGKDEFEEVAYQVKFVGERIVRETVEVSPGNESVDALRHQFKCDVAGAYYLPWVFARPLDGRMMPKGTLSIRLDGELMLAEDLSSFLPDPDPIDCSKPRPWKVTPSQFKACSMTGGGSADGTNQIGVMIVNGTKAKISLSGLNVEEKASIEVGFLAAYYSTKESEVKGKGD